MGEGSNADSVNQDHASLNGAAMGLSHQLIRVPEYKIKLRPNKKWKVGGEKMSTRQQKVEGGG